MTDQVAEVKAKTDIVEVISEHVDLKKAGRNYKGLCPFHGEKTPSFMVSPELQIYKCFGCARSGDVFSFLMEMEAMEFPEALKTLADKAGVNLVTKKTQGQSDKEKLYELNAIVARFYQYILLKHSAGNTALNYLLKGRGLSRKSILEFSLGFAPDSPSVLKDFLVKEKKINIDLLKKSGIFYERSGNIYDRFRGRVIFPLFDHRGNAVGFAGRLLPKDDHKKLAKYLNTPETPVYHKSDLLYGLNTTKTHIKKTGRAVLVEGDMDMISTYQAGIKNVAAIKGSALTMEQSKLLKRFANQLIFALDTDVAGIEATLRGIQVAQKDNFEVRVAVLGDAKDPDELARSDPQKLRKIIDTSVGAWDFIIDKIFEKYDSKTGTGKANISSEIVPVLASIDDAIVRSHYVSIVAKKLQVTEEVVLGQIGAKASGFVQKESDNENTPVQKQSRKSLLEDRLVAVIFRRTYGRSDTKKAKALISDTLLNKLLGRYIAYRKANKNFDPARFSESLSKDLLGAYAKAMFKDELDTVDTNKEFDELINELVTLKIKEDLKTTENEIKLYESQKKVQKLKIAENKFAKLTNELAKLSSN